MLGRLRVKGYAAGLHVREAGQAGLVRLRCDVQKKITGHCAHMARGGS
jgi:hypothetical protein